MQAVTSFIAAHKPFFDLAQAVSSIVNLFAWMLALVLLLVALRRSRIESLSIGPFSFRMLKEEAIVATAAASRAWTAPSGAHVDVPRIRATFDRAFTPEALNHLTGKAVLWADDNPANNELAVRALRKFGLDIEQVISTDAALAAMQRRKFDLVISDMGRGSDMRAGYGLLSQLRERGSKVPFFIFAGSDTPQFRREAAERGAQLSTNDMLELVDRVVSTLGTAP
ncbi:MAG: response regulator [Hyphomicrobiaceae bacterium]|nr:response regulator [Hyphomicrobiaceae bacterium]